MFSSYRKHHSIENDKTIMSQQFTKLFQQTHYYGYTDADDDNKYRCDDGSTGEKCVRNFGVISESDVDKYGIHKKTRSSHDGCGHCSCGSDKVQCATTSYPKETITWDKEGACATCPDQKRCSIPNLVDCLSFADNKAIAATQNSRQVGQDQDEYDRTIKCTYNMTQGGTQDFSKTSVAQAYLNAYSTDDTWNTIIAPYFCSFPADSPPSWAGKDQPYDVHGKYPDGAITVASRFVGSGKGGDADMCRTWVNTSVNSANQQALVSGVMSTWCDTYKWLPECACMMKTDKTYGDPYFADLYFGLGSTPVGCWYAACSRASWDGHETLVTPPDIYPVGCGDVCQNVIINIGSHDISYDDIQQEVTCEFNEEDIPYPDNDIDCSKEADPKQCACNGVKFTMSDKFIQDSVKDMPGLTNTANQQIVLQKANQYATTKCYSNPTFSSAQYDAWLSLPPILDKVPKFDPTTGVYSATFEDGMPTEAQKSKAYQIMVNMMSDTQYPCQQTYSIPIDIADPSKVAVFANEKFSQCLKNQSAKFGYPDKNTNACPYTFEHTDIYGVMQTYQVDSNLRTQCVSNRDGIEYLPVDGDNPDIDDIDKQYHLTDPVNGACPSVRTYTDEDGVEHTKNMTPNEISACKASPDYDPNADPDNEDDSKHWFDKQSDMVQLTVVGVTALVSVALIAMGGFTLYKAFKAGKAGTPTASPGLTAQDMFGTITGSI